MWPDVKMLFTDASSGITKVVDDLSVRIYPNPVSDILYVEGVDIQKIEIFDGTGRQVYVSIIFYSGYVLLSDWYLLFESSDRSRKGIDEKIMKR